MDNTTIIVAVISYIVSLTIIGCSVYMRTDSDHNFMEDCLFAMFMALVSASIIAMLFAHFLKVVVVFILLAIAFAIAMAIMWLVQKLFGEKK